MDESRLGVVVDFGNGNGGCGGDVVSGNVEAGMNESGVILVVMVVVVAVGRW